MKRLLWGVLVAAVTAGVVYGLVALEYEAKISKADADIKSKSGRLIELWSAPPPTPPVQPTPPKEIKTDSEFCFKCHDRAGVSSFHFPEDIMRLERRKGQRVSVCTTCHGSPVMPVHFKAIQNNIVECETCHIRGEGPFTVPQKREGDLLICQLCHANGNYITIHVEGDILEDAEIDKKWIKKREGKECTICHGEHLYGNRTILDVHAESASSSGRIL